jgi:nucleotide sugar dehydrogenase
MNVGVIGAGRLGLGFALVCDKHGIPVFVSDKNETYRKNLKNGFCFTNEPFILDLLSKKRFLEVMDTNEEVIKLSDLIWTFVETPSLSDGQYDITKLHDVVNDIQSCFEKGINVQGKTFIIGCTTNPGDVENISNILSKISVNVVYNPEFVAQGEIIKGIEQCDMVLLGTNNEDTLKYIINLYRGISDTHVSFNIMSYSAAELTKIAINSFLTTKISFANMIGEIAINSGMESEVQTILRAIGSDSRVGKKFLKYGFGFGGPCLPRDNRALSNYAKKYNAKSKLSELVDEMNIDHTEYLATHYINKNPNKKIPFVMKHISYKKGTDILTDSQQYNLCLRLLSEGYTVFVQEIDAVINQFKLKDMSEIGDRLKFFKNNTKPEGYLIDL